jgi:hypothetical protein
MELLGVLASVAGMFGLAVGVWQRRVSILDRRDAGRARTDDGSSTDGALPVAVPTGRLPAEVLGRDDLLAELDRGLDRRARKQTNGVWVLAGMGGVGKSTVALRLAVQARTRGRQVWWVNAANADSLRGGVLEILRQIGAPEAVARVVREGEPTAPDRVWEVLSGRRGLLILDNADDPGVLAADGASGPADGTGWIRPGGRLAVLVTTRHTDANTWGAWVRLRSLKTLDDASAATVLRGLAPRVGDPSGEEALALARRLGGLPLALHLAGTYLATPFARWHSFADYREALDGDLAPDAVADLDSGRADPRDAVLRTWELSMDALAEQGVEHARELLCVLSCFAPGTPIPGSVLSADAPREWLEALRALATVALIEVAADRQITVHPVVADTGRTRLLTTYRTWLPAIGRDAVTLVRTAVQDLDSERPSDWPSWQSVIPHIRVLLLWLAPRLEDDALIGLLRVSGRAFSALWLDGHKESAGGEELARTSLAVATRLGTAHPEVLAARHVLATALNSRERLQESEEILRGVLDDRCRVLGETHPDTLDTRDQLADVVMSQGRFGEAEQMLARWTGAQGRHEDAEEMCREILEIERRVLGGEHPLTLRTGVTMARAIAAQGRRAEAAVMLGDLLQIMKRTLGDTYSLTVQTARDLAALTRPS